VGNPEYYRSNKSSPRGQDVIGVALLLDLFGERRFRPQPHLYYPGPSKLEVAPKGPPTQNRGVNSYFFDLPAKRFKSVLRPVLAPLCKLNVPLFAVAEVVPRVVGKLAC